ncbi:hypothetical protein QFC24_000935 [Naganishia onofrii]|uniref:Uncharacterized protein n=1 Tax=Naganishia onofrii TaxID=1851511 RepID=A0ACC2XWW9_9TREE|nr:hypothetical protein QFC24_000935 [Naganishia onofrii]
MRVSQVTLIALSSVALSTFASPVAQFLPTSNDVVTDAPMKSTVLSTEAPVFTIQTSTEIPYARRGESITDDGDDYDDYDDEDDADDADDADDGADDNEDDDDIEDGDDYGDLPFCDEEPTTSSQYSSSSTGSYVDPTPTVSSTSAVATPTSTGKISRIYPVRALISRCLAVDDDEPADGSPVTM